MAKIFRFSGYFVDGRPFPFDKEEVEELLKSGFGTGVISGERYSTWQQFHVEESEELELDGELEENCDLALLTRHFKHCDAEFDRPLPKAGEQYRHFKLGKIVTVLGVSRHTETEEVTVVYEYEGKIWNRPLAMFLSEVDREKYPEETQRYRFERVKDLSSHSEEHILEECIDLMKELAIDFQEWYLYVHGDDAIEELDKEERFCIRKTYFEIVQRLLLYHTNHSGGSSTRAKCKSLGIDDWSDDIEFGFEEDEEE